MIWPWPQPTRSPNWMRLTAMPLSVAEQNPWRSSAASLRWASQQSGGLDWELWPGAYGPLTTPRTGSMGALAYRNERGRQDRLYASCFLRSKRGGSGCAASAVQPLAADITSERLHSFGASAPVASPQKTGIAHPTATTGNATAAFVLNG